MKKRVVIISAAFLAVAVLAGLLINGKNELDSYKQQLQNEYSMSLSELNSGINNISLLLEKTRYATTPAQVSSLAAQLFSEAELAKSALSKLPVSEGPETVNRFLSQVGNYVLSISKSLIRGEKLTAKQEENLKLLSNTAKTIAEAVSDSDITYNNSEYWAQELEGKLTDAEESVSLADSLTELEENLTDYPTLIYDGPYSDHITEKEPLFIQNKTEITEADGLVIAADTLDIGVTELAFSEEEKGKIEAFRYGNQNVSITVSKKGGYPVYFRKLRQASGGELGYERCLTNAKAFLEKIGYKNMQQTYYFTDGGICVINFAFLDGQTLCYTDLVKVGVATDSGEIMILEASGYLTNHTERAFEVAAHSEEEARAKVSRLLTVNSARVALIPSGGGAEKRCYEFTCTAEDGREVLVYINVQTLEEEQIFILLKSDGGVLVK